MQHLLISAPADTHDNSTTAPTSPQPTAGTSAPATLAAAPASAAPIEVTAENPSSKPSDFPARVLLLDAQEALPRLRQDLLATRSIYAWIYLVDPDFFGEIFKAHLPRTHFFAVADHRQKRVLQELAAQYQNFRPRTWAWNRTLHDKTILLPELKVAWILTHNLTRGSWTLSSNRAARIESAGVAERLGQDFSRDYCRARTVLPRSID